MIVVRVSTGIYNTMEDRDTLSSFYANLCYYFSGDCSVGKCYLVKKHKENLKTDGDFSLTLNDRAQRKHAKVESTNSEDSNVCQCNGLEKSFHLVSSECNNAKNSRKIIQDVVECSNKWSLKVSKCSVQRERLCLFLNRFQTFETLLHCILSQKSQYGRSRSIPKKLLLTADISFESEWTINMTDYRKHLVSCVLKNLLTELGHTVLSNVDNETTSEDSVHYHLTSVPSCTSSYDVFIHCGVVINAEKKCKEKSILSEEYLRQRCEELKVMSHHKHGGQVDNLPSWNEFFRKIGEATLRIDLLSVRPSRTVTLNFHQDCQETSRNSHFILYNCARLAVLQEKFDKKCSEKTYPSIVPLNEVDFSLLVKEEEWELLSGYLLIYPQVLQNTVEHLDKGKPMPNLLCQFLYSLCVCYSSYYRRVRVLTEPRDHLLPIMFARLYLLQAIESVLHNGLRLLGIEPVRYM